MERHSGSRTQAQQASSFPSKNRRKFCSSCRVVAERNLIQIIINDFVCLRVGRDRDLASDFNVAICFYVQTTASVNVLLHRKGI